MATRKPRSCAAGEDETQRRHAAAAGGIAMPLQRIWDSENFTLLNPISFSASASHIPHRATDLGLA